MLVDAQEQGSRYVIEKEDVIEQRTICFMGGEIIAASLKAVSISPCQACAKQ